jgi:hypothetical protein
MILKVFSRYNMICWSFIFYFFEAHNLIPNAILSRFRLYLLRPPGLQEDIGSIGAKNEQ